MVNSGVLNKFNHFPGKTQMNFVVYDFRTIFETNRLTPSSESPLFLKMRGKINKKHKTRLL